MPAAAFAQYPNVRVSDSLSTDPEEVAISINPANPLNVAAGVKRITWNGRDAQGIPANSGVYFYTLRTGGKSITRKMTLLK